MAIPPDGVSPLPYANEDARERRDMIVAGIFTILYFLLFAFFWITSQTLTALQKKAPDSPLRTNLKIQRIMQAPAPMAPPMQSQFVDASGLKEVDKPDPRTALQSDRNTAASSKVVNGTDPTLGGQEGKKDDSLTMRDSQFSPNPASPPPSARLSPSTPKPATQPPNPAPPLPKADLLNPTPGPGVGLRRSALGSGGAGFGGWAAGLGVEGLSLAEGGGEAGLGENWLSRMVRESSFFPSCPPNVGSVPFTTLLEAAVFRSLCKAVRGSGLSTSLSPEASTNWLCMGGAIGAGACMIRWIFKFVLRGLSGAFFCRAVRVWEVIQKKAKSRK